VLWCLVMGLETVDLDILYSYLGWATSPDDPRAIGRFSSIVGFADGLLEDEAIYSFLEDRSVVRVLDIMAASGIAGVAFAKALVSRGLGVELTVADVREGELRDAWRWLQLAGLGGSVKLATLRADARRLPQHFPREGFDVIVCWGSSLPHFDVYDLILFLSGSREVLASGGVLVVEQADILPGILINNIFRRVLVEGNILTIYKEYDAGKGVQRRLAYRLPTLEYLGVVESRLWDIAQVTALAYIFYSSVKTYSHLEMERATKVVVAAGPRASAPSWRELADDLASR